MNKFEQYRKSLENTSGTQDIPQKIRVATKEEDQSINLDYIPHRPERTSQDYKLWLSQVGEELRSAHALHAQAYLLEEQKGMPLEEWEALYIHNWMDTLKKHPDYSSLALIEKKILIRYQTAKVSATRTIRVLLPENLRSALFPGLSYGLVIKRGDKGSLIDKKGLDLFPENVKILFNKALSINILCAFKDVLIAVPPNFVKIKKDNNLNLDFNED